MSRPRRKLLLVALVALTVPAAGLYAIYGPDAQYEQAPQTAGPTTPLLTRAIKAHGGQERLSLVRAVESQLIGSEAGRETKARLRMVLPDRYRHDIDIAAARLVHGAVGEDTWSTLDGVPVLWTETDVLRLQEQMALVRCGLLVDLESDPEVSTEELGFRDGLEWLKVEFESGDVGPFRLGFDPDTSLLTRAEWNASVEGRARKVLMSMALSDFRQVDGVVVGFQSAIAVDGEVLARQELQEVSFEPVDDMEIFRQPEAMTVSPIVDRTLSGEGMVIMDTLGDDPENAQTVLDAFIDQAALKKNGPAFRDLEGERVVALGVPVELTGSEVAPAAAREAPRLTREAPHRVLSTVVIEPEPDTLKLAEQRLRDRAATTGLVVAGPVRRVTWKESIVQVQLPVKDD